MQFWWNKEHKKKLFYRRGYLSILRGDLFNIYIQSTGELEIIFH